jgi:hypothetical protein
VNVDFGGGVVVEESSQLIVKAASVDDRSVNHHCVTIERPHGELASGELVRKVGAVVGWGARLFVEKDRAARSVWTVDGEGIVSDEDERFADLGIAEALSTRVAGLGVGDETLSAGGTKLVSCVRVDWGKSIVGAHVDNGTDRRRRCLAAFGRNASMAAHS